MFPASIIITSYNYARYLPAAIDSALAQDHRCAEVIVVDDGSTDDSAQVIGRYGERVVALLKDNGGQASAMNAGYRASSGRAVIFLDSDDVLLPTAAARVVAALEHGDVAKVHWSMPIIDAEGHATGELEEPELAEGDLRETIRHDGPFSEMTMPNAPTSGNGWSQAFLEQVMPIPEEQYRIGPDTYLFGTAPAFGRIVTLPEPQSLYRRHDSNQHLRWTFADTIREGRADHWTAAPVIAGAFERRGLSVDVESWSRRSWFLRLERAVQEILRTVPTGASFALVDEDGWGTDEDFFGRRRVPFTERHGAYNGPPDGDGAAIAEAERLRRLGVSHLVFAWQAFWWLEHFEAFAAHLRRHWRCILHDDVVAVFVPCSPPSAQSL